MGYVLDELQTQRMWLWVDALVSGEYDQGHGLLELLGDGEQQPQLCCLGVLCRVAMANGAEVPTAQARYYSGLGGGMLTKFGKELTGTGLPAEVASWLFGIDPSEWHQDGVREMLPVWTLIKYNDTECMSFDEIASYIEHYYQLERTSG